MRSTPAVSGGEPIFPEQCHLCDDPRYGRAVLLHLPRPIGMVGHFFNRTEELPEKIKYAILIGVMAFSIACKSHGEVTCMAMSGGHRACRVAMCKRMGQEMGENDMQIKVRLIGAFRIDRFKERIAEYPVGTRVEDIVVQLQIPKRSLGTVLINGVHARIEDVLREGDTVALLPILGGG